MQIYSVKNFIEILDIIILLIIQSTYKLDEKI